MPPRAPLVPTAVHTYGRTGGIDAYNEARHKIFDMALRFDLNQARVRAHTLLTALARSAQCTGVYAWSIDACLRDGALTILTGMTTAMHNLAVRTHCTCRLHPNSKFCISQFQPTPARTLHSSNPPEHTRMFSAPNDRGRKHH